MFGTGVRAVCFTENSQSALNWLISTGRHVPWGVAFSKDLVFKQGGGPAIEVRGDDWPTTEFWPAELRARVKRLWPGAQAAPGATIPWYLEKQSEWSFEREWRLPINDLLFQPADVALVICESEAGLLELVKSVRERSEPMALHLEQRHHLIWDPALKVLKP